MLIDVLRMLRRNLNGERAKVILKNYTSRFAQQKPTKCQLLNAALQITITNIEDTNTGI